MVKKYSVLVGNVGTVKATNSRKRALETWNEFVDLSKLDWGRQSGESVHLLEDGEPVKEYFPSDKSAESS